MNIEEAVKIIRDPWKCSASEVREAVIIVREAVNDIEALVYKIQHLVVPTIVDWLYALPIEDIAKYLSETEFRSSEYSGEDKACTAIRDIITCGGE